ncbi:MAG: DUF5069 domain-containing protein [Nitrospirae bacterium]|nr:DUF5069 domain-containing protein [Nitrospirota bacterium]
MRHSRSVKLRSPREKLGGYSILPRLIDKVRLHAEGKLPLEYLGNLLKPGRTLDGWFLAFTGLEAEALRQAISKAQSDDEVLEWVERRAILHTEEEKRQWAKGIAAYRPDAAGLEARKRNYPELAAKVDLSTLGPLEMIDMDEERIPIAAGD